MRINADHPVMSSLVQDYKNLILEAIDDYFGTTKLIFISKWLQENLERLRNECQGLLLEVARNQKITQSQLEVVCVSYSSQYFPTVSRSTVLWRSVTTKTT